MAAEIIPNLGLKAFYADGEDGWGDDMSTNLLKLSVLVQGGVKGVVAAVPADETNPALGDAYILEDDRVAIRSTDSWVYLSPRAGWLLWDLDQGSYLSFDGATWAALATGGGDGGGGEGGTAGPADRRVRYVTLTHFHHYNDGGSLSRVRFRGPTGADLPNPAILYDGVGTGGYPFAQALDDTPNSFFSTYQGNLWGVIVLDFGALVEIAEIAVTNRVEGNAQQAPASFVAYGKKSLITPGVEIATTWFSLVGWNANAITRTMPLGFVNEGDAVEPEPGPTAYNKYRVYITEGNNPTQVCMGELRCYDAEVDGVDITDQRSSIFFSGQSGANTASNVFDENDGNGWFDTQVPPNFVGFDLPAARVVRRITIGFFFRADYMPKDFKFQGSNDNGATWIDLLTVEDKTDWNGITPFLIP